MPKKKSEAALTGPLSEVSPQISPHINRLSRIRGQIGGIDKMIGQERNTSDILIQIEAARSALKSLGAQLLESHLRHSLEEASLARNSRDREKKIEDLLEIFSRV